MGLEKLTWLKETLTHIEENLLGERVSVEQGEERRNACLKCDRLKEVNMIFFKSKICGECKCPIDTKPFFKTHLLQSINPLIEHTEQEREVVKCPHPFEDKWKEIDKKYA